MLDDAMALARAFERRLELDEDEDSSTSRVPTRTNPPIRPRALPATSAPHTPPPAAKTVPQTPPAPTKGPPPAGPRFKRLTQQEMAQRKAEGLCFNCPEKFTKDHACMKKGLYLMELDDDTPVEDAAVEESSPTDDVEISIHALTGIKTADTMHLATSVAGTSIRALVDSGSTHSFIAADTARRLGLQPAPRPGLTVGVANGERVPSAGVCAAVPVTIGTEEFHIDLFVLPLPGPLLSTPPSAWTSFNCSWLSSAISSTRRRHCLQFVPVIIGFISYQARPRLQYGPTATPNSSKMSWRGSAPTCSSRASSAQAPRRSHRPSSSCARRTTHGGSALTIAPSMQKQCATSSPFPSSTSF